jgi:hypothetical protein
MSPDTMSALFPDRPMRPLPKRRLRERLASDVADNIVYPPVPPTSTPLFQYPYNTASPDVHRYPSVGSGDDVAQIVYKDELDGLGEHQTMLAESTGSNVRWVPIPSSRDLDLDIAARRGAGRGGRQSAQALESSAASSVDGYETFENSNNKKKRKIPTLNESGIGSGGGGMHSINDLNTGAMSGSGSGYGDGGGDGEPGYSSGYVTVGGSGVAGPGRGRYGRSRSMRSPLRPLADTTNTLAGRHSRRRPTAQWAAPSPGKFGDFVAPQFLARNCLRLEWRCVL